MTNLEQKSVKYMSNFNKFSKNNPKYAEEVPEFSYILSTTKQKQGC